MPPAMYNDNVTRDKAVERPFYVRDQHVFGSATDAMRPQLTVVTCRFYSRVWTRANLYLALHVAGRGYPCLDSALAVEQPPTAIPRTTTYKARPSTKLTNNYHVRPRPTDFITFWPWLSRQVLSDQGFTQ